MKRENPARLLFLGALIQASSACFGGTGTVSYTASILYEQNGISVTDSNPNLSQIISEGQLVSFANDPVHGGNQAQFQSAPSGAVTLLRPTTGGFAYDSYAYGTNGSQQVGQVSYSAENTAVLWNGSASSVVNLDPSQTIGGAGVEYSSTAFATNGAQQVGEYTPSSFNYAVLWSGSAASAVSLQPTRLGTFYSSDAIGTDGVNQVGYGLTTGGLTTALLWSGTAASAVNLDPSGGTYNELHAQSVSGNEEVGYGLLTSNADQHALAWTGTASSLVDLNPSGFVESDALGTNGTEAVGEGQTSVTGPSQATLWTGDIASTAVNLGSLLPSGYTSSTAYSIDSAGNIFGVATDAPGNVYAVEWSPASVPEPTGLLALLAGASCLLSRRFSPPPQAVRIPAPGVFALPG